jgi:glucan phosphoethanolaminetransferase (alkaline phosphatase superfamily)
MPCWPDLWNEILRLRFLIGVLFALVLLIFMLWAPRIKWRWLRISLRVVAGVAAILIVPVAGLALLFVATDAKPEYRTVNSPTGLHQATLMYHAGFLGRDFPKSESKVRVAANISQPMNMLAQAT